MTYPRKPLVCGATAFLHPLVPTAENAFNPCFLTALVWLISAVIGVSGAVQLYSTWKKPVYGNLSAKSTGFFHWFRCSLVFLHTLLVCLLFSLISVVERYADHKLIPFGTLALVSATIVTPLHVIEPTRVTIPLGSLLCFWPVMAILELVLYFQDSSTQWPVLLNAKAPSFELLASITSISIFILEYSKKSWRPTHELLIHYHTSETLVASLHQPNFIDRITFLWMNNLITNSYKKQTLEVDDLPEISGFATEDFTQKLQLHWGGVEGKKSKAHLAGSLLKAFGPLMLSCLLYDAADSLLGFVQPQLLRLLIIFIGDKLENPQDNPVLKGALISASMFAVTIIQTALSNQYMLKVLEVGLGCRSSLTSLIFRKSLRLSTNARSERSTGDIVNLISIDTPRIQTCAQEIGTLIIAPTELFICIYSLWQLLGKASLAGVVAIIVIMPINTVIVRFLKRLNKLQMKLKDYRNNITNEILVSMKSLKLYSWEIPMLNRLLDARNNKELKNLKKIRIINQVANLIWVSLPFMVTLATFSAFVCFESVPLTSEIVFPALSLLNLLSRPILSFPMLINYMTEASVALDRISDFLLEEEVDDKLVKFVSGEDSEALRMKRISFVWNRPVENITEIREDMDFSPIRYALKDINIEVKKGDFICAVGKVGSGKSSLLSAIIGQLDAVDAHNPFTKAAPIELGGTIAYCSQNPWIMNASVKDNILFGFRYDEDYYNKTIDACELLPDLNVLPDGDATQVGEKGITLSGGQKARLALARAVYSRADIYLLDDVLSAVDSHVGKSIVSKVLSRTGLLAGNTVILATNNIGVLSRADKIYLFESGSIVEAGSYSEAVHNQDLPKLNQLLQESGNLDYSRSRTMSPPIENSDHESTETCVSSPTLRKEFPRKASVATFDWNPFKKNVSSRSQPTAEISAKGKVKWKVYWQYIKACSLIWTCVWLVVNVAATLASVLSNYSLKKWADRNSAFGDNKGALKYIAIYAVLGFSTSILNLCKGVIFWIHLGIRGGQVVHDGMARRLMKAPMSFFERTPVGRIMNRFSNDINKVDDALPRSFNSFMGVALKTIMTFIVVGTAIPPFAFIAVVLFFIYGYYQKYYISVQRELKRLVSISRSPIFAHFQESLTGVDTIRAYRQEERFSYRNNANVDFNIKSLFMLRSINRWLSARLQLIGSIIVWSSSSMLIYKSTTAHPISASMAGFVMSYALQVTTSMRMMVRMSAEVEANIVSVERCFEYCELPMEEDENGEFLELPDKWPSRGEVRLENYSTRYAKDMNPVLRDVTISIKSGEKVGVVGRTGAGKSSLVLALFRILPAIQGRIEIDELDISHLRLFDLRHNLSIIPQDAHLFEGTIRQNLDPFGEFTDEQLWRALEHCSLAEFVRNIHGNLGLESRVSESGCNFSAGQRQLMCLGRALLSTSKILMLDEATAAVDVQTDKIIQATIRKEFKDKTIITIAHRLDTVMDSDRILALDQGQVSEFDTPANLLQDENSVFYNLCKQGSYI